MNRDGVSHTKADGSGVFAGDRLIMTARHVVHWYWDRYNNSRIKMICTGHKIADFEMSAAQAQGNMFEEYEDHDGTRQISLKNYEIRR